MYHTVVSMALKTNQAVLVNLPVLENRFLLIPEIMSADKISVTSITQQREQVSLEK